jgi:small subunit ribosomal protein S1
MVNSNNSISKEENNSEKADEKSPAEKAIPQKASGKEEDVGFRELYEQSLQSVQLGQIVTGKVVQINSDVLMVDVGWKTEGYIPARELKDEEGNIPYTVGDELEVLVDRRDTDGNLVLSRDKAVKIKVWDDVKNACEHNIPVKGTVVERVKGGLSVDIGILAFLPGSQVDVRPVRDLDKYVGQTLMFNVLKYDRKRNNVVLSRRSILEQERVAAKRETLEGIEEGKIMEGVIKNITDYGLFIDLGGIDGLLHVTDISWGRITRPSDNFSKGDKIRVKVLSFDREKERVSLGLKQLMDNPWEMIEKKYAVGSVIEGKVVNLTDYGVFVEMEPGVEGLVHITEMFWTREIKHPSKVLSVGDIVKVMVLDVNPEVKRISLGLKQTTENPWEALKLKYPEGSIVKGVIRNITNFGFFVGIEEGIDGLVHVSDISWKQNVKHPSELYKKGQEVEAMVLNIDVANEKFSLGIKQVDKNPWDEKNFLYAAGSVINGKVTNVTDFGIFVELEEGVEGLVHVSELSHKRVKAASEIYAVGDVVSAIVKSVDLQNRRIRLSIKDYESPSEASSSSVTQYLNNKENVGSNLGKVLADVKMAENDKG